jgi:oligopeptide transport system substrate-binding protein
MKRFFICLLAFLVSISILTGCNISAKKPVVTQIPQKLIYNITQEPQYLDPGKATGIPEFTVILNLFDGLTRYNEKNEIIPSLAERWDGPDAKNQYTFYLRKDAKWSNGDPVTAKDFEYSWKRALSPEIASEYAYQLYYLKNGKTFNSSIPAENQKTFALTNNYFLPTVDGKADSTKPFSMDEIGVKATDDYTLVVKLEASTPFFISLLTFTTYLPVNQKIVETNPDWAKSADNFVGNGPYKMSEWKHAEKIIAVKNDFYWDASVVKLSDITFLMVESQTTELAMFESGTIDFATNPPSIEFDRLKKENKLLIEPYLGTYYYAFNTTKKPFDNLKVRRALTLAINRQAIVDNITKGGQLPAMAYVPFGIPDSSSNLEFRKVGGDQFFTDNNIEEAKSLLADAGFPGGKDFPEFNILYNTSDAHKNIAQAIQQMWKENLGLKCNLINQEWKVYLDNKSSLNFDVARAGWIGDFLDPSTFLDMFYSKSGNSDTGWKNPKYDKLIEDSRSSNDNFLRIKYQHEAETLLMDELPIAPIYFYTRPILVNPKLQHYLSSTLGYTDFKWAEMAEPIK